jgi:hypothetical protein
MGWTDTHLYEFRTGGVGWGVPDPDGYYDGPLPASKTSLLDVLEDGFLVGVVVAFSAAKLTESAVVQ